MSYRFPSQQLGVLVKMRSKRAIKAIAASAIVAIGLASCTSPEEDTGLEVEISNAAIGKIANPSDKKGGIIKMANEGDWDSLDPGETYYGYSWNFLRNYGRSLVMFKSAPGEESSELVPDLAEELGEASDDGKTWTYKLRKGVKYEDGTEVTSADVKHAVLRSTDKKTFPNGPAYFEQFLDLPKDYKGPYKSKGVNTDSAIETPDDQTIVFHLKTPFAGFDYLAQLSQTVPVPEKKDKGAKYREHVISTGPYMFDEFEAEKKFTLKRNPNWDPATDPNRKALPDGFEVSLNVSADDIDNKLKTGDLHVHIPGIGVTSATQGEVLTQQELADRADNPTIARLWYTSINDQVIDNIDCRKAIMYAWDRVSYQTARGGEVSGGQIATTVLPPQIPGYKQFDLYPPDEGGTSNVAKAKEHLKACGKPDGFETNIAYRNERDVEKASAESLQQALKKVGIKLSLKGYAQDDYFSQYAGHPGFAKKNNLGLVLNGWGADWNDGFGFLSQIVDSRVIRPDGGSSNISVRIPEVDKMLDDAVLEQDEDARNAMWGEIDKKVMENAVIIPGVYAKSLMLRGTGLTNVFINDSFGMYDYLALGLE